MFNFVFTKSLKRDLKLEHFKSFSTHKTRDYLSYDKNEIIKLSNLQERKRVKEDGQRTSQGDMLVNMLSFSIWGCHHTFLIRRNFTLTAWLHVEKKNQINTYKCWTP